MAAFARFVLCAVIFLATYFFSVWMIFGQLLPMWIAQLAALVAAFYAARYCWRKLSMSDNGVFTTAATWGAVIGAIGFCGGFFGPMIFAPEANQGPLLGIFITGPGGFAGGFIAGLVYALWKRKHLG